MIKEKFIVEEGQENRVDKFLAENVEELSRSELKGYFEEGKVLCCFNWRYPSKRVCYPLGVPSDAAVFSRWLYLKRNYYKRTA